MRARWSNLPIPEAYVSTIVAGFLLQQKIPKRRLRRGRAVRVLGWPLLGAGLLLAGWAASAFGADDSEAPTQLVTTGPYAHSRNPMYVAWTLIQVGIALVTGTAWVLELLPAALLHTHLLVVPREERQLTALFGDAYRAYKARVRAYF